MMGEQDHDHDGWKFAGCDADAGLSRPGAALFGGVPCHISRAATVFDAQPGQTGLPGRNCSGR